MRANGGRCICTALANCSAGPKHTSQGSQQQKISISRRNIIIAGCLASIAAWTLPSQAAPVSFKVALTGAQQVPPVQTGANGTADLNYDPATRMLTWSVTYNGLSGPATMAHFHGPAAEGKNGAGDLASRKGGYGC